MALVETNFFSPAFGAPASSRTTDRPATSMSDYYHNGGALTFGGAPYDLDAMGSWGAARKAAKGYRYIWFIAPNHYSYVFTWGFDSHAIWIGYSNDPAIPPDPTTMAAIISPQGVIQSGITATFNAEVLANGTTLRINSITPSLTDTGIVGFGYVINGLPVAAHITAKITGKGGPGDYTLSANQGGAVAAGTFTASLTGTQRFSGIYFPMFVYNPDEPGAPGFLYIQGCPNGAGINTNAFNNILFTTADLDTWTLQGAAFTNMFNNPGFGTVAQQTPQRISTGNWVSFGPRDVGFEDGLRGYYTSTDGRRWEYGGTTNTILGNSKFFTGFNPPYFIGAQKYTTATEDARGSVWSSGTTYAVGDKAQIFTYSGVKYPNAPTGPRDQHYYEHQSYVSKTAGNLNNPPASSPTHWDVATDGGMFLTQVAIDTQGNCLASPAPTRLSAMYAGIFPQESYISSTSGYLEDGIRYNYVVLGFFPQIGTATLGEYYENGGGMYNEYLDLHLDVIDATAAASAAPPGLKAKCSSGNVTLNWYDVIPGHAYRIYRGTSAGSITTNLGDVSSVGQYVDSTATLGSVYYYKVVTLNGGVEAGSRVVSTYVGAYDQLTNKHMTRVLAAGADPTTINEIKIKNFVAMLTAQNLLQHLMLGRFAWMGVAKTSVVTRCFDLGTTRLPRMGDYTPWDTGSSASTTTYSATAVNGIAPGLINPNTTSRGMYGNNGRGQGVMGRLQALQRKEKITVISSYRKNGTGVFTPMAMNEFSHGMVLSEGSGAQGTVTFLLSDTSTSTSAVVTATAPALSAGDNPQIVAGMWDGSNLSCWANGASGTPVSGAAFNPHFIVCYQQSDAINTLTNYPLMMGSSSSKWTAGANVVTGTYIWSNSEARGTMHADLIFDTDLNPTQMAAVNAFVRNDANGAFVPTAVAPLRLRLRA